MTHESTKPAPGQSTGIGAKFRLVIAAVAFVAWLSWLAVAVAQKDSVDRISRAQLTAADVMVVAEIRIDSEGKPLDKVIVRQKWSADAPAVGTTIEVMNLESATPPGKPFPGPGEYLLPLITERGSFRVAGLPRSPGFEGNPSPSRPVIYPWGPTVEAQLRTLGFDTLR